MTLRNDLLDHPQSVGILGVLISLVGIALLVSAPDNEVSILMAGYSLGLGSAALGLQVVLST